MGHVKCKAGVWIEPIEIVGDRPCLCFEARPDGMTDEGGVAVKVLHDILIKVLLTSEIRNARHRQSLSDVSFAFQKRKFSGVWWKNATNSVDI